MLQMFFMFLILSMGLTFCFMKHPLAMGLILLVQTTYISVFSGLLAPTFWFSYILFLVFLGGMLVLFIYVTSLASNEMFSLSSKTLICMFISLMMLLTLTIFLYDPVTWTLPTTLLNEMSSIINDFNLTDYLFKLYNTLSSIITMLLISYLFLTLVIVVSITNINEGPLRSSTN
uniref:NADH-ubiquinone oxidoreductase chain 6 n=1 Tax=Ephemera orientalis TaxID=515277 RepID=C3RUN7_9INSE|nr:NADH dehydrogenase subunit 6 [Ephemera orientalis]ACB48063.1 NADH dehydrogenase subunit 6 [Ephemera orientalis]